jgi:hypothetical protein
MMRPFAQILAETLMHRHALPFHDRQVALGEAIKTPWRTWGRALLDQLAQLMRALGDFFAAGGPLS